MIIRPPDSKLEQMGISVVVSLSRGEVDLIQQALFHWGCNHPGYLAPNTPERLDEINAMSDLHKQFKELRMQLKGGD